ncbi:MAG: DUF3500 domain-containing protein [Verrucomicrobiales bacterium]
MTYHHCPDCPPSPERSLSRRDFIRQGAGVAGVAALAAAGGAIPLVGIAAAAKPGAGNAAGSETLVKTFYQSLSESQRARICFPFDHELRKEVDNNWQITDVPVRAYSPDQQAMIKEIFIGMHSPEYAETVYSQVVHDSGRRGFEGGSAVAIFGEPGTGDFEFVLTGRHCTRRCDGESVEGTAFGGPIFYGHAAGGFNEGPGHEGNAYWYQALRANEVFEMLDGKQRKQALAHRGRKEDGRATVALTGQKKGLEGIRVADLSADQKGHVRKVVKDILAPFRQRDAREALRLVEAAGFDNLHMAFYQEQDIGNDGVWDVWQIEGPSAVFYFRGDPHVHAWIHVRDSAVEKGDPFKA